ncbi:hypothetical protein AVEN_274678-1 [Araneus ventricosus]|uniref:Uncharacterized protein n=1 Tax=Araneus ventricosus TaxID=182803 RepID=A0A4Y2D3M7_ARAVE|nr:hypothetical protein AVEN_98521-1 [Araneus ventricosus]GBM11330.1 hypothetical protein AVEN_274678-1 [Araneus ventricosus]
MITTSERMIRWNIAFKYCSSLTDGITKKGGLDTHVILAYNTAGDDAAVSIVLASSGIYPGGPLLGAYQKTSEISDGFSRWNPCRFTMMFSFF